MYSSCMALHLRFSNRVEPLVDSLSQALDELWTDLAFPPDVVVPSPAVSKWLKLRLCERRSALLNLPTPTLEGFLWRSMEPGELRFLKGPALSQALVPLLDDARLSDPRYARVHEFLVRDGRIDPRRRLQLSQELARLFLEYEYNRPSVWSGRRWAVDGLDRHWPGRAYFDVAGGNESEEWQRDLYGAVFAPDATLALEGYCSLPGLHRRRREEGWSPSGTPVLLFLVDKVSHFHRNLLMELSQERDIHLFLQNPCAEFWEDVDTSRRTSTRRNVRLPRFEAQDYQAESLSQRLYPAGPEEADPLLLARWGQTARENICLWSQAADYAFDFDVEAPIAPGQEPTVLSLLQQSLLERHPGPGVRPLELPDGQILSMPIPPDSSITVLACPERGREMEAVRDQILEWLSEDLSRSPSDCLVLLADPSRHRTEIHRVFGGIASGDAGWIPWAFLGEPGRESRFARGVEAIGALLLGGMDRPGVFELFRNPLCRKRLDIDPETVQAWERWAEGSGMLRGWDAGDRAHGGDQEPFDTHTFRAGILRLYAARLAAGDLDLDLRSAAGEVRLPGWRDFESSDPVALDGFVGALERLHTDLESLKALLPGRDLAALSKEFLALCDAWLDPDGPEESQVRKAWRQEMTLLALQAGRPEPMELDELVDAVKGFLPDELPGSARAFAGSLTFAPLRIGNLVPHELVVVAGLESDAFPRAIQKTSLDLLGTKRLLGDAGALQDDRHTFLSVVLSARSRLVLSWRAEDLQKDREIESSSVLQELCAALGEMTDSVTVQSVRLLSREPGMARKGREPSPVESWDPSDAVEPVPASEVAVWERPDAAATGTDGVRRVTLAQLRGFLENPYLRHLRQVLGFQDEDGPDTTGSSEETLESDAMHAAGMRKAIFEELVSLTWQGKDVDARAAVARILARSTWEGYAPEGDLLRLEHAKLRTWAEGLGAQLSRLRDGWPVLHARTDLSLGRAGREPLVRISLGEQTVELTGSVPFVLEGERGTALLALSKLSQDKASKELRADVRRRLDAWLQAAALQMAGEETVWSVHLSRELPEDPEDAAVWQAWERPQGELTQWLQRLVEDLVSGACEFLPVRELLGGKKSLDELREAIETGDYPDPLERLFRPALPGEPEDDQTRLEALLIRRLRPLLNQEEENDGDA
jgi:exonuclease V gamma subunit